MDNHKLRYILDISPQSTWLTVTVSQAARSSLLYVQELGIFYAGADYFTERQGLDSFLIKYTISGEATLKYNGKDYLVKPHQLFWLDCTEYQYYRTHPQSQSWDVIWVHFYGPGARQYYELFLSQNGGENMMEMEPGNSVWVKLNSLITMYRDTVSDFITDIDGAWLLTSLLLEIIKTSIGNEEGGGAPEYVLCAKEYINESYAQRISLDGLSLKFHVNKFHFLRVFKKYVGLTPNEFIIQTRLNKAKEFLRTTSLTVTEISSRVGVPNTSYFINLFKAHEDMTPSAYRRLWYNTK